MDHLYFTGGGDCAANPPPAGNKYYIEPIGGIPNACYLYFDINDDISNALRAEIYMDIWRGHTSRDIRFKMNGGPTRRPDVGEEWSRTPYIADIPLSELVSQGTNEIKLWKDGAFWHIHDIAIRVYHDANNPLYEDPDFVNPVVVPTANLVSIEDDDSVETNLTGGNLQIDGDQLTLTAYVSADAKFVEFHAFYDGYDEDNDGQSVDWHNRDRNNWHPGGVGLPNPANTGGTIDHIGSIRTTTAGNYSVTWDMAHILAQTDVKFKVRVVDGSGNARDAAGGVTGGFTLERTAPMVSFMIPDFEDVSLNNGGALPATAERYIDLPQDVASFDEAYLVAAYWKDPLLSINGQPNFDAFPTSEHWHLSIKSFPPSYLTAGTNHLLYSHNFGWGEFIEKPGPMIVLKRNAAVLPANDNTAPEIFRRVPDSGDTNVDSSTSVKAQVYDSETGVVQSSIQMYVNGGLVSPTISGSKFDYTLNYSPPMPFADGSIVNVRIVAQDAAGNSLDQTHSFTVKESLVERNTSVIYVSSATSGSVPGINYHDDDILAYNTNTSLWSLFLDGSDIGLNSGDINGFAILPDDSILLSFTGIFTPTGLSPVDPQDIVKFIPTSTGQMTAGTFEYYFDGSDVDLTTAAESVNGIERLSDGRIIISTEGHPSLPGFSGLTDSDMLAFTPTSLGENTSGSWNIYFDGSDVGMTTGEEDVFGLTIDEISTHVYLSPNGPTSVPGLTETVQRADTLQCIPSSLGSTTSCTMSLFWDGSANGLGDEANEVLVDGISLGYGSSLAAAILVYPADENISVANPEFRWEPVDGATDYELIVYNVTDDLIEHSASYDSSVCTTTLCTVQPNLTLDPDSYTWLIQPSNSEETGPWSTFSP
ncbi:MAG: hypothetical protein AAF702_45145 [Chloroflexota bacterium]